MVERLADVLAERVAGAARRDAPAAAVVRVRPQQVAHRPLVRHLLHAIDLADLVECVDGRREAAVQAEDLVVDQRGKRQVVEQVGEVLPHVRVAVLAQALVIEAIHLRDLARLVVAAQNRDAVGVAHLERHQQRHGLHRVVAAVDVVAHEQVVGIR